MESRSKLSRANGLASLLRRVLGRLQRHLNGFVIGLVAVMAVSSCIAFVINDRDQDSLQDYIYETRDLRIAQIDLLKADVAARNVVMSGHPTYLSFYARALGGLGGISPRLLALADGYAAQHPLAEAEPHAVTRRIAALRDTWAQVIELGLAGQPAAAQALLETHHADMMMAELDQLIGGYIADRSGQAAAEWQRIGVEQNIVLAINLIGGLIAIGATAYAFARSRREAQGREAAIRASNEARRQVETLFGMTDILQSAQTSEDANAVLRATATELLPDCGGVLYVFNNSRDRLDLAIEWGGEGEETPALHITPDSCWALKRGKPHLNETTPTALRCSHALGLRAMLEIPIVARGEIYGLLAIRGAVLSDAAIRAHRQPIAVALADAMSLALSNIALRERLRNQALRDPLTSLYNRRFLEEMLERLTTDAERRRAPLAVIMMDLDHFKKLNDRYGHAAGDLVLRNAAAAVLSCLRPVDVACRYGGEELAILLPDCTLEQAAAKAEQIRARLVSTSANDVPVTASFGVASMPETCGRAAELMPTADKALYLAKDQGRDRVVSAPLLPSAAAIPLSAPVRRGTGE